MTSERADIALAEAIVSTSRRMNSLGINRGTSGNVSARTADGLLITPSGMPYAAMQASDIVRMHGDGRVLEGGKPSSEWRFHRDIYARRPDANAIVHTHASFCTTLACLRRPIPAFHYMVAVAGGVDIRCAPYATFGTQALSDAALAALVDRRACLLANHGMIALGSSLGKALDLAVEVEALAEQYWRALQLGEPFILDAAEMAVVLEKFRTYGGQASVD